MPRANISLPGSPTSCSRTYFERDKALWDKRVSTEQQYLRSRNSAAQTRNEVQHRASEVVRPRSLRDEIAALAR